MKQIKLFLVLGLMLMSLGTQAAKKIYTLWDSDPAEYTLTFIYTDDVSIYTAAGFIVEEYDQSADHHFDDYYATIEHIIIDPSMREVNFTNLNSLFYGGDMYIASKWEYHYLSNVQNIKGLENLNTSNVTSMYKTFYGMSGLTSLDLSSWDFGKVDDTYYMFNGCENLETICCNADLTGVATSTDMFYWCLKLTGYKGTTYNKSTPVTNASYACPDGLSSKQGYFTPGKKIYTSYENATLTYYYDNKWYDRPTVEFYTGKALRFIDYHDAVITGVIDESVKDYPFTTLAYLFNGFNQSGHFYALKNMTKVIGLEYLNGENVTDMGAMFYDCDALTEIDLGQLKTPKVESIMSAFSNCAELKVIDLSSFDPSKLKHTKLAFCASPKLETIYSKADWSAVATLTSDESYNMFQGCVKLVGGKQTKYDSGKVDKTYARPDEGTTKPGYFTTREMYGVLSDAGKTLTIYNDDKKGTRENVSNWPEYSGASDFCGITKVVFDEAVKVALPTKTDNWFAECSQLATIEHLDYLNTSEVATMDRMFYNCEALSAVDAFNFSVDALTSTYQMFFGCNNLEIIYSETNWDNGKITDAAGMFRYCDKLKGGLGTPYDAAKTGLDYARPDEIYTYGYFTTHEQVLLLAAKAVLADSVEVLKALKKYALDDEIYTKNSEYVNIEWEINTAVNSYLEWREATTEGVKEKTTAVDLTYHTEAPIVVDSLKKQVNRSFDALLKDGDSDAVKQIINDAKAAINTLAWDFSKTVEQNVEYLRYATSYDKFMDVKPAVDEQRKKDATSIDNQMVNGKCQNGKLIRDGQILILRGEKAYTATGQEVK